MKEATNKKDILQTLEGDKVFDQELTGEMQSSFLEYAMSVIKSRALPDYRDGLKPVHRRIIYAAAQEGLTHDKKYKKSAAIVGSVMGSYHPHGDAAIYDALVRMAQDFSLRYPLIQGQGNFGSIDGDSPAAMRYTEARLSELSSKFIEGLGEDWVDMVDNYDQSKKEPVVLPTLIPNLLVNGSEGIAVGLATKIPPHNLSEVIDAAIALIERKDLTVDELKAIVKGPDFPTGGEVLNYPGVLSYFEKPVEGKRSKSFILRGKVDAEDQETGTRGKIVITEIPYGVKKSSIITRVVACMDSENKRATYVPEFEEYIRDIRDESSKDQIRLVIEYNGCKPEVIINNLFKHTRLQVSFCTGMVVLVNNKPERMGFIEVLKLYVDHQREMIQKKAAYRIGVLSKRIHILEGRMIIVNDVMEAVRIITSSDEPEKELQTKYQLSDEQLKDILDLRIRRLKKLSVNEMKDEMQQKIEEKQWNQDLLDSEEKQWEELIKRLTEIKEKYGDKRRTTINEKDNGYISPEDTKHYEDVVFILSKRSFIKQIPLSEKFFNMTKKRRSKTSLDLDMSKGDAPKYMISCHGKDDILFFTDKGRVYKKKAHELSRPNSGLKGRNRFIKNMIPGLGEKESVVHMMRIRKEEYNDENLFLMFVTQNGMVKRTKFELFKSVLSNGKVAIRLMPKGGVEDKLRFVLKTKEDRDLVLVSSQAKSISKAGKESYCNKIVRCPVSSFRTQSRVAMGRRGMRLDLKNGQEILSASTSYEGDKLVTVDSIGKGKFTEISKFTLFKKGGNKGMNVFSSESKERECVSCVLCNLDDDILMTTNKDKIYKCKVSELGRKDEKTKALVGLGKTAKGVRLLSKDLEDEDVKIIYATKLPFDAITNEGNVELDDHSEDANDEVAEESNNQQPVESSEESTPTPQ